MNKYYLAIDPNTSTEILEQLATDESPSVRCNVAENPNTQHYIKRYLKIQEHLRTLP
jgi:hypothetical protein